MNIIDVFVIISIIIFYMLFIGRTIILYKNGVKVWVIGTSTKKLPELILENILFPALLFWTIFVILITLHVNLPPIISRYFINIVWLKYIGIALCFVGLIIFLLALISFGKAWRIGIDEKNTNELITTGMFKYSRNPIFLFMDMYFMGIMLIYPNIVFIIIAICTVTGIHLQILREEKFLENKFGEKYIEYKRQTRRYI
ncbi:MAG: isoprenylcysteine carboxylmethyltransferase family protein [Tannerella sp.]|jgi:protein-S-isoprenylcysteine O-methyltransferase Ste14|nr:isoprenylcysteine carboxylmethyltransferase family protein [Tannerella sp.]